MTVHRFELSSCSHLTCPLFSVLLIVLVLVVVLLLGPLTVTDLNFIPLTSDLSPFLRPFHFHIRPVPNSDS
jgi:hypothetical protein